MQDLYQDTVYELPNGERVIAVPCTLKMPWRRGEGEPLLLAEISCALARIDRRTGDLPDYLVGIDGGLYKWGNRFDKIAEEHGRIPLAQILTALTTDDLQLVGHIDLPTLDDLPASA